ncbi:hypothetical protein M378DRAFT_171021 [Amanita muscaria Koide BX008]|uniref:Uncharacterized protein n=1 Tax=Amanita muscaria (strain Koide BX008) TaxID=946122 RepID=A0A0C2WPF3_AMAMK|nr:hypothetical protein M378DRAFT_171021 [Amanita muscaria Koide BX008]
MNYWYRMPINQVAKCIHGLLAQSKISTTFWKPGGRFQSKTCKWDGIWLIRILLVRFQRWRIDVDARSLRYVFFDAIKQFLNDHWDLIIDTAREHAPKKTKNKAMKWQPKSHGDDVIIIEDESCNLPSFILVEDPDASD